jgi:hypothetical protein
MRQYEDLRQTCTYCHYGTGYRKATDIWSSIPLSLRTCTLAADPCDYAARYGRHFLTAQRGPGKRKFGPPSLGVHPDLANHIPQDLIETVMRQAYDYLDAKWPWIARPQQPYIKKSRPQFTPLEFLYNLHTLDAYNTYLNDCLS